MLACTQNGGAHARTPDSTPAVLCHPLPQPRGGCCLLVGLLGACLEPGHPCKHTDTLTHDSSQLSRCAAACVVCCAARVWRGARPAVELWGRRQCGLCEPGASRGLRDGRHGRGQPNGPGVAPPTAPAAALAAAATAQPRSRSSGSATLPPAHPPTAAESGLAAVPVTTPNAAAVLTAAAATPGAVTPSRECAAAAVRAGAGTWQRLPLATPAAVAKPAAAAAAAATTAAVWPGAAAAGMGQPHVSCRGPPASHPARQHHPSTAVPLIRVTPAQLAGSACNVPAS